VRSGVKGNLVDVRNPEKSKLLDDQADLGAFRIFAMTSGERL
jgi:hypothetical protein